MESKKCRYQAVCGFVAAILVSFVVFVFIFGNVHWDVLKCHPVYIIIKDNGSLIAGLIAFAAAVIALRSQRESTQKQIDAQVEIAERNRFNDKKEILLKELIESQKVIESIYNKYKSITPLDWLPYKNFIKMGGVNFEISLCKEHSTVIKILLLEYSCFDKDGKISNYLVLLDAIVSLLHNKVGKNYIVFFDKNPYLHQNRYLDCLYSDVKKYCMSSTSDTSDALYSMRFVKAIYKESTALTNDIFISIGAVYFHSK